MTTGTSSRTHALQATPIAACITLALCGVGFAATATTQDNGRVVFRDDPAARIFPAWRPDLAGSGIGGSAGGNGNTLPVTSCADDGPGTLRSVIAGAGEHDTVDLTALACARITLETGAIPIMLDNLDVVGPGADRLTIDGGTIDRVFLHYGGGEFALRDVTIADGVDRTMGFHVAGGGCIASAGYLTLDHSVVANCYAVGEGAYGGALYAYSLTMRSSTITQNTAYGVLDATGTAAFGGAAFVYRLDLIDSTVSGNRALHRIDPPRTSYDIGGGLMSVHGGTIERSTIDGNYSFGRAGGIASFDVLSIINSTISGNSAATELAGGIFIRQPVTLILANSTVTANNAPSGAGIVLSPGGADFQSNIVSGNIAIGGGGASDLESTAPAEVSGANNLIGASAESLTLPADTLRGDPQLMALAANGGPTRTHALRPQSPAIDAGNNAFASAFDQRGPGFPRVSGAAPDIGAFERSPTGAVTQTAVPGLSIWSAGLLGLLLAAAGWRSQGHLLRRSSRSRRKHRN
ncbi:MAG: right-handed parallel beta-helix repeat-containing protein [Rhodanobacteraceae bacterium]